jgi:hypothetical protein
MSFPNCQYSHVTWIRIDSPNFIALNAALKTKTPQAAIRNFLDTLVSAHKEFQQGVHPGANLMALLKIYQDKTGIISRRDFSLPDVPSDPNDPGSSFATDLIEGITGAVSTEAGVGILMYTLVLDLIHLLDIKLHVKGILLNNSRADLDHIAIRVGPDGEPNLLPLSRTIPGLRKIMNPVDKKNYECVGFVLFGAVGVQSLEGFSITLDGEIPKKGGTSMYFQYYSVGLKGVSYGTYERHGDLHDTWCARGAPMQAAMVDGGFLDTVCLFSTQPAH